MERYVSLQWFHSKHGRLRNFPLDSLPLFKPQLSARGNRTLSKGLNVDSGFRKGLFLPAASIVAGEDTGWKWQQPVLGMEGQAAGVRPHIGVHHG